VLRLAIAVRLFVDEGVYTLLVDGHDPTNKNPMRGHDGLRSRVTKRAYAGSHSTNGSNRRPVSDIEYNGPQ